MFSPNTVFILGAGASFEVGLPLGMGLKRRVKELVHFERNRGFDNKDIYRSIAHIAGGNNSVFSDFYHAAERIMDGLEDVSSIDTFLDMHRENAAVVALGKMAICLAIVEAERASVLSSMFERKSEYVPPHEDTYRASWFVPFGELLTQGIGIDRVEEIFDNISVITFNYDRTIELFAEKLLRRVYGIGDHAISVASKLDILHVYGKVGSLYPAQGERQLAFGEVDRANYAELSEGIRTFTETVDSEVESRIGERVRNAETLVFLGFGWLPQNMKLFDVEGGWPKRVFFTTKGIAEPDRGTVIEDISHALGLEPERRVDQERATFRPFEERGRCVDLLRNHWRLLTRA